MLMDVLCTPVHRKHVKHVTLCVYMCQLTWLITPDSWIVSQVYECGFETVLLVLFHLSDKGCRPAKWQENVTNPYSRCNSSMIMLLASIWRIRRNLLPRCVFFWLPQSPVFSQGQQCPGLSMRWSQIVSLVWNWCVPPAWVTCTCTCVACTLFWLLGMLKWQKMYLSSLLTVHQIQEYNDAALFIPIIRSRKHIHVCMHDYSDEWWASICYGRQSQKIVIHTL